MSKLGRYELHEILGKGGFGTVYRATDSVLNRVVAIKVLHPQLALDSDFIARFQREAQVVAALDHPNIVPIYDMCEAEGRFFLVMKYLAGGSLAEQIQKKRYSYQQAVDVMKQVCAGLQQAHARGMVHRDVKPANILFDAYEQPVIGDFGLAKVLSTSTSSSSTGGAGTPFYRAPEVWRGKPPISPATDVYALGCIFYEMLAGKLLFPGETTDEVLTRHLIDGPEFAEHWSPSDAPAEIESIIRQALSRDPAQRFADAITFSKALQIEVSRPVPMPEPQPPAKPKQAQTAPLKRTPVQEPVKRIEEPERKILAGNTFKLRELAREKTPSLAQLAFEPNGNYLAVAYGGGIYLYDPQNLSKKLAVSQDLPYTCLGLSPDSKLLVGGYQSKVQVWGMADRGLSCTLLHTLEGHTKGISSLCFSPKGTVIATGSYDNSINLWVLMFSPGIIRTFQGHTGMVSSMCFSPDGKVLASGSWDNTIRLWDPQNGQQLRVVNSHSQPISTLCFSPNGQLLVSGSHDSTIEVRDTKQADLLGTLKGHYDSVSSIAFSPDGKLLASGSKDGTVALWDMTAGSLIHRLNIQQKNLNLCFSPDGTVLATGSSDGTIILWGIK